MRQNPYYAWAKEQPDEVLWDIVLRHEFGEPIRAAAEYELAQRKKS